MAKKSKKMNAFLEELETIPNISLACKKVGLSRNTIYRWRKEDYDFKQSLDLALSYGLDSVIDLAESKLIGHINDGNLIAIRYFLDNNKKTYMRPRPKDYWVRQEQPISFIEISPYNPEEHLLIDSDEPERTHF